MTETDIVPLERRALVDAAGATAMVDEAARLAQKLASVIKSRKMALKISNREYVKCEGWTTLGAMMGVFPEIEWTRPLEGGGWEARCLVRRPDGAVLGAAEAQCDADEPLWANRTSNARRSMAQTRATGKAMRVVFSWVMTLAGYEPTPAEEMDGIRPEPSQARRATATPAPPPQEQRPAPPPPQTRPAPPHPAGVPEPPVAAEDREPCPTPLASEVANALLGLSSNKETVDFLRNNVPKALLADNTWSLASLQKALTKDRAEEMLAGLQALGESA